MKPEKENVIEEVFTPEQRGFKEGMIVQHFKRETIEDKHSMDYLYQILHIGVIHTETKEPMMVYQALYGDHSIYSRPLDMFCSKVDKEKYPDIKQEFRLEPLDQLDCVHLNLPFGNIHEFETIEQIVNGSGLYKLSFIFNNWDNNIIAILPVQDDNDCELSYYFEQIFDDTYEAASSLLDLYKKYSPTMPFIQYKSDDFYEGLCELNKKLRTIWEYGKGFDIKEISIFYNLLHVCQKYYNDEINEYGIMDQNLLEGIE